MKETISKVLEILRDTVRNELMLKGSKGGVKGYCYLLDPKGFFTPTTLKGKLLLQEPWSSMLSLDREVLGPRLFRT